MNAWRPIETAPRDASRVLLVHGESVSIGFFDADKREWMTDSGWVFGRDEQPTRWMLLPPLSIPPVWQPMETAPTDGTLILAWGPNKYSDGPAVVEANLFPFRDRQEVRWERPNAPDDNCLFFTHWMPIPEQPE